MAYDSYPASNIFTGMIDESGTIYEASTGRKRQPVGIDSQREQELLDQINQMQSVIDNYYEKLVSLGEIVPPKSAEEIAREQASQQAEINQRLLEAISGLQAELSEIKGVKANGNAGYSAEPSAEQSEGVGAVPRQKRSRDERGHFTSEKVAS